MWGAPAPAAIVVGPIESRPTKRTASFLACSIRSGSVEHSGRFERIVETAKVKTMRGIPVYDETDVPNSVARESYVTVLVHLKDLSPEEQERLLQRPKGETCDPLAPRDTIIITDLRSNIERRLGRSIP